MKSKTNLVTELPGRLRRAADTFDDLVAEELAAERTQFADLVYSHGCSGVIRQAVDEFTAEAARPRHSRSRTRMLAALVRVAAVARWAAEDLGLLDGA